MEAHGLVWRAAPMWSVVNNVLEVMKHSLVFKFCMLEWAPSECVRVCVPISVG